MSGTTTEATLAAIRNIDLGASGKTWLLRAMTDISLEMARGTDVAGLIDTLLERRRAQIIFTGEQRDKISQLLTNVSRQELNNMILLLKYI